MNQLMQKNAQDEKLKQEGYALGHFGDNSSHVSFDNIHPSPGKKSDR